MKEEKTIYIDTISGEKLIKKIFYHNNDYIEKESYYLNDKLHRKDGPATIEYWENGNIEREYYRLNNKCHREDGPAIIYYDNNGNIEEEFFYKNNKEITDNLQIMVMLGLNKI